MARPKKAEEKAKDSASLQISVEDFVRTRDSLTVTFPDKYMVMPQPGRPMTRAQWEQAFQGVAFLTQSLKNVVNLGLASINTVQAAPNGMSNGLTYVPQVVTGLATLQSAVQDLSRAYIAHTNTVIGKGPGTQPELLNFNPLGGEPLFGNRAATPVPNVEGGETKKRKRAPHDKNAPKRPVTPYFLYMQTARSLIANEMPPGHTAKQVADEGTRRWLNMPDEEKKRWSYKYGVNFARYKEKSKAYKEGRPLPDISDEDAKKLYDDQIQSGKVKDEVPLDPGDEEGHEEEDEESDDESESSSSEEEPEPEPPKVPTPPKSSRASKRQKGGAPEKKSSPIKQVAAQDVAPAASPNVEVLVSTSKAEKKRGSKKKNIAEPKPEPIVAPASSPPKLTTQDSQHKAKKSRKKRKSEAVDE